MKENGRLLSLRLGQIVLAVSVLSVITALLVTSFLSVSAHDNELQGLFSEEADGTAMTFVQRESFGVILELDDWARDEATARDVQIARALLGQRLQVVTASGATTFELTDELYRESLVRIDELVRAIDDRPVAERVALRVELDGVVDSFESRTRELSTIFQEITRTRAAEAIERRAAVEQVQGLLSLVVVIMGVGLAGWLAVDLRIAYARASQRLTLETRRLEAARRSLDFRHELQVLARSWSDALASGAPTDAIVATAGDDLARLMPGIALETTVKPDGTVQVARADVDTAVSDETALDEADVLAAIDRANESLRLAQLRDNRERSFELERQHDPLTGLPNRERLPGSVADVALIDIDRFADFNTSFGHLEGDRLLVEVARRLRADWSDDQTVLRLSADEFAVVGSFPDEVTAQRELSSIADRLSFACAVGDESAAIAVTVGAVVARSLDDAPDALIQRAAAALASAQGAEPRIPVRFFAWDLDEHCDRVSSSCTCSPSSLSSRASWPRARRSCAGTGPASASCCRASSCPLSPARA